MWRSCPLVEVFGIVFKWLFINQSISFFLFLPSFLYILFSFSFFLFIFYFFCFLGLHPKHMEFPRPGVELELQLPAYTTATALPDANFICDLQHSSLQCQILNWARPGIEPSSSWILVRFLTHWATTETVPIPLFTTVAFQQNEKTLSATQFTDLLIMTICSLLKNKVYK